MNRKPGPPKLLCGSRHQAAVIVLRILLSLGSVLPCLRVHAATDITPTIGAGDLGTQVTQSGNVYGITGGQPAVNNLFHSFGQFSIGTGDVAQFQTTTLVPNTTMSNILARVTGGNPSSIFGTVDSISYYPNANLFLMNPHGILFGPSAQINIGGMAHFTTADYFRLSDAVRFELSGAQDALLSTASVAAFGFSGSNPAAIAVQGSTLMVQSGQTLSLVGGNRGFDYIHPDTGTTGSVPNGVTVNSGTLSAPGGQINLAVTASPGEFLVAGLQPAQNINQESFSAYGTVSLAPDSTLDVSQSGIGKVSIRDGQFVIDVRNSLLSTAETPPITTQDIIHLSPGSSIVTANGGIEAGNNVEIVTETFSMEGASIRSITTGEGSGGHITVTTGSAILTTGAQIVTTTESPGTGGNILLESRGSITIAGSDPEGTLTGVLTEGIVRSGLFSTSSSTGTGGDILVSGHTIALKQLGTIASTTISDGQGGNADIAGNKLSIKDGGEIRSETGRIDPDTGEFVGGLGPGGTITITADESVLVSGLSGFSRSGITSTTFGGGDGGAITIISPSIAIEDGAQIRSVSVGDGVSGDIALEADTSLTVRGFRDLVIPGSPAPQRFHSSVITGAQAAGDSGAITVTGGAITLAEEGRIQTVTEADGRAGSLTVTGSTIELSGGGFIEVLGAGTGATGAVNVTAHETLTIRGLEPFDQGDTQSRISNDQSAEAENGGISILAREVLLKEGGRIRNDSLLEGSLTTIIGDNSITIESGGRIASRADLGAVGPIELHAPTITLDEGSVTTRTITSATGGTILLDGQFVTLRNGSELASAGEASTGGGGPITVLASDSILVSGGSSIQSISFVDGPAGDVYLNATNSIALSGSGTTVSTQTVGTGTGGAIILQAQNTSVTDGAVVTATSTGSGAAGSVTIEGNSPAQSILIDGFGSGLFTDTQGTGAGGDIFMNANSVTMTNGATVSASSTGQIENPGDAGSIDITATNGLTMQSSAIKTQAGQGASGGTVKVTTSPAATVLLQDSLISASVGDGPGGGGNISIDPQYVILQNSQILAQAAQGQGGAITIITNLFLADATSIVNADSGSGVHGTVTIQSPNAPGSGKIQPLGKTPLEATSLLNQHCAALAGGEFSSFTVAGRNSLPTEPSSWLASPLYAAGVGLGIKAEGVKAEGERLETPLLSLRQIAPAGFLTQAFAVDWSAGCQS